MKRTFFVIAAAIAILFCGDAYAQVNCAGNCESPQLPVLNGGVGPVIAGTVDYEQLPDASKEFIKKHFKGFTVVEVEKEFSDNTYEVELNNGLDMEFDAQGQWMEVDAGRSKELPSDLVKKLLPDRAHRELSHRGVINQVESIKRYSNGYKVELRNAKYDDYRFAKDCKLLIVSD